MILAICISNVVTLMIVLFLLYKAYRPKARRASGKREIQKPTSMFPYAKKGKNKPKVMDDYALWKKEQDERN